MAAEPDNTLDLIADVAADFARFDAERVRKLRDGAPSTDRAKWSEMAELGWIGVTVPEEDGGAGLGMDAVAILVRSLGRAAFPDSPTSWTWAFTSTGRWRSLPTSAMPPNIGVASPS